MNKFKKTYSSRPGSKPNSGRPAGRRPSFGAGAGTGAAARLRTTRPAGRDREEMQKFDAVCSKCGKACQVPFRPSNTRPVYCKDCFGAPQSAKEKSNSFPIHEGKSVADLTRQIAAMNTKIDTMLRILQDGATE
jgi:CxxC-x17-CxxC domain-containing protein